VQQLRHAFGCRKYYIICKRSGVFWRSTDHAHQILTVPAEDIVDQRPNTGDRGAVLNLYQFHKGQKDGPASHNYGVDQETLGLLDALCVVLEQFALVASGWPIGPPPLALLRYMGTLRRNQTPPNLQEVSVRL
jgi:hypothetical protein